MNRADRRKKIPATEAAVVKELAFHEGIEFATGCIYSSVCMILHDNFGFGSARCKKLLKLVQEQVDSINKGYVSLEDIKKTVDQELDIKLIYSKGVEKHAKHAGEPE